MARYRHIAWLKEAGAEIAPGENTEDPLATYLTDVFAVPASLAYLALEQASGPNAGAERWCQ